MEKRMAHAHNVLKNSFPLFQAQSCHQDCRNTLIQSINYSLFTVNSVVGYYYFIFHYSYGIHKWALIWHSHFFSFPNSIALNMKIQMEFHSLRLQMFCILPPWIKHTKPKCCSLSLCSRWSQAGAFTDPLSSRAWPTAEPGRTLLFPPVKILYSSTRWRTEV